MIQIKDTYVSLKKIRKISYINNYKGFSDNNYIVIIPLIDMEILARLHYYFNENDNYKTICIFGLEEHEEVIKRYLPECEYKGLRRRKINELLAKYGETGGEEDETI